MSELGPDAKKLIQSGKGALDPTAADQARVREALQARLTTAGPGEPVHPSTPPPFRAPWALLSTGIVGAGLFAGLFVWNAPERAPPARPRPTLPTLAPAAPLSSDVPAPDVAARRLVPAPPEPAPAPPEDARQGVQRSSRASHLAEEVALLSKATRALHARQADEALRALGEHQRKFPNGVLTEERLGARAQALCLLGRKAEAERTLAQLSPSSPQAASARKQCGPK